MRPKTFDWLSVALGLKSRFVIGCRVALMSSTVSNCFFLKEDSNRTNNVSDTNTHSDCRLRLPTALIMWGSNNVCVCVCSAKIVGLLSSDSLYTF